MILSIVKGDFRSPLNIENCVTDLLGIPSILQQENVLCFPVYDKSASFTIEKEARVFHAKRNLSDYCIWDIKLKDEFAYDKIRNYLQGYQYHIIHTNRGLQGWIDEIRLILYVDGFRYSDYKLLGNLLVDAFKEWEIQAEITTKYNYFSTVLPKKNHCRSVFNNGILYQYKMLRRYRRPKNYRSYKPELYPIVLEIFKELGFFPNDRFGQLVEQAHFTYEATNNRGYMWYSNSPFNLWHSDPGKKINIYEIFAERYKYKDFLVKQSIEEMIESVGTSLEVIEERIDLSKLTDSNKKFFIDWGFRTDNAILCIKSAMGSAKTAVIKKLMDNGKTLVVTPRMSLAVEAAKNLEVPSYLDMGIDVNSNNHLVCQFDSLYKFDLTSFKHFIIDEYMTLESHISECSNNTLSKNMAKLQYILDSNVILVDAMLTKNCLDIFSNQRRYAHWYENSVVDGTPLMQHKTFESFLKEISLAQGKRISISCTSKEKLKALQEFVDKIGYTNRMITGDTALDERYNILKDYEAGKFNCLMYSPALSVGININSDVEKHFHYDPGGIISPIQSIQMIRRARKTKQIDCFVQRRKKISSTSIEELRADVKSRSILCEYNAAGDQKLLQSGKTFAWMKRHDNIWRLEGRDSFDYLASLNFNVTVDVEIKGSGVFKGQVLNKFKENSAKWPVTLREKALEYFGDNLLPEKYLEPKELESYKYFSDLYNCYNHPANIAHCKLHYYNKGNFKFEKDLEMFTKVMDNPKTKGDFQHLGFEKSFFSLSGWHIIPRYANLYKDLNPENPEEKR